ncbi:MAG: hypothetical protein L0Z73_07635 [Gammaproteobacteria bacterium]|nr:hypothetical protein [Gammaproteobacteria bacterium]
MVRHNYPFFPYGLLLTVFYIMSLPAALAGDNKNIARCFDANGDITYTDFFCYTFENDNPLLMSERAVQRHIRDSPAVTKNAGAISTTKLSSSTSAAIARCTENFARYFKRRYRSALAAPSIEFNQITDQFSNGSNISISALGVIQYEENASSRTANIECTAQKLHADSEWQVGFMEK